MTYIIKKFTKGKETKILDQQSFDQVIEYLRDLQKRGFSTNFNSLAAFGNEESYRAYPQN